MLTLSLFPHNVKLMITARAWRSLQISCIFENELYCNQSLLSQRIEDIYLWTCKFHHLNARRKRTNIKLEVETFGKLDTEAVKALLQVQSALERATRGLCTERADCWARMRPPEAAVEAAMSGTWQVMVRTMLWMCWSRPMRLAWSCRVSRIHRRSQVPSQLLSQLHSQGLPCNESPPIDTKWNND